MKPATQAQFQIAISEGQQYACWPLRAGPLPHGWIAVGPSGSEEQCLGRIHTLQPDPFLRQGIPPVQRSVSSTRPGYSNPFPDPDAPARLLVFPHAGAGTAYYHFLAKALAENRIETLTVAYPGREARISQPACASLSALLDDISPSLEVAVSDGRPFIFYGHSMGALVAFELVRQWRDRGLPLPSRLVCSGRQAPSIRGNVLDVDTLSDAVFIEEIIKRYQAIPAELLETAELLELVMPALRADFSVVSRYVYRQAPPLPCPIALINGRDDPWVNNESLEPWKKETDSLTSSFHPGGHFFLQNNVAPFCSHMVNFSV